MYTEPSRLTTVPAKSLLYVINVLKGSTATKIKKALRNILMGSVIFLVVVFVIGMTALVMIIDSISS